LAPLFQPCVEHRNSQQVAAADDAALLGNSIFRVLAKMLPRRYCCGNDDLDASHSIAQNISEATQLLHAIMHRRKRLPTRLLVRRTAITAFAAI
jgi:hypothetical protein